MKRKNILVLILIVLCIFFYLDQSCANSKKLLQAIGAHDQLKETTEAAHRVADQKKVKHEEEKKQLQDEIETLTHSIRTGDLADAGKAEKLEELETEEPKIEDKDEKIKNVKAQNEILRGQLATALSTIEKIGKPIFTLSPDGKEIVSYPEGSITDKLNKRFLAQVKLTVIETGKFNAERILRISAEGVAEQAIKDASRLRLGSKLKTGGVVVLAGILVYSIVRK